MAKFWRAWLASEIVAIYDKVKGSQGGIEVHLRNGQKGLVNGIDANQAIKELEGVLASDQHEETRLARARTEAEWLEQTIQRDTKLLSGMKQFIDKDPVRRAFRAVASGERVYLRKDEVAALRKALCEEDACER